jgi:hypothetical protein
MSDSNILITFKYQDYTRQINVARYSTIKNIIDSLEAQIKIGVRQLKMLYKGNNILLQPETTKVYDYFGDVKDIELELVHKDFAEDSFISAFEKAFIGVPRPDNNNNINENEKIANIRKPTQRLKSLKENKIFEPQFMDRPICNYDGMNEASYICLKCRQYWCEYCKKYEVHQKYLTELNKVDLALKIKRNGYLKELDEKVLSDEHYDKLDKIDFLLNEKISVIDKQFNEMINIINRIKESQMKFIIDYFYQKVSDKKFRGFFKDIDFYQKTINDLEKNYNPQERDTNIKNVITMHDGLKVIINKFEEFKIKYEDFNNVYMNFYNFNELFKSQVEAKIEQNLNCGREIKNPEQLQNKIKLKDDLETVVKSKSKGINLIKIKYYNSIMIWNHLNQKLIRVSDFEDEQEFKLNYQVFAGNIFLNHKNKLFIVTGANFNMFYYYDPKTNKIIRLPSLKENHCRGGMIYVKYFNSIFCISGKYTKQIEFFNLKFLQLNNKKDTESNNSPSSDSKKKSRHDSSKNVKRDTRKMTKKSTHSPSNRHESRKEMSNSPSSISKSRKDSPRSPTNRDNRHKTRKESSPRSPTNRDNRHTTRKKSSPRSPTNRDKSPTIKNIRTATKKQTVNREGTYIIDNRHLSKRLNTNELSDVNNFDDDQLKWDEFASLKIARHYACFFLHNETYLYVFLGYNQIKGYLDSIEKIDLKNPEEFELIKYENPKLLDLQRNSMACCYANQDEIYILGGCIRDKPTDEIIKYNFKQNAFFKTEMKIPAFKENEYFRFWEESTFIPLTSKGNSNNSDDYFTFGALDARDKVHLFNIRTFKYNII